MEGDHLDVEGTLRDLYTEIHAVKRQTRQFQVQSPLDDSLAEYEKKIGRIQKWGWIWGVFAFLGTVFSAGVGYAVFLGENATDTEVEQAIEKATKKHNGGIDPQATDPDTHEPIGQHPDLRKAIESNTKIVKEINDHVLPRIETTQKKMDKRTEYQFEFTRWQARVIEAKREKRRPPRKPTRLDQLETELMLGKYD